MTRPHTGHWKGFPLSSGEPACGGGGGGERRNITYLTIIFTSVTLLPRATAVKLLCEMVSRSVRGKRGGNEGETAVGVVESTRSFGFAVNRYRRYERLLEIKGVVLNCPCAFLLPASILRGVSGADWCDPSLTAR